MTSIYAFARDRYAENRLSLFRRLSFRFDDDNVIGVREIEYRARAFIQHIGVEMFGPEQRYIPVELGPDSLQAFQLALQCRDTQLELRPGTKPMVADEQMVGEIANQREADKRYRRFAKAHNNCR